ncbi:VOC family protein [Streptomyces sp. GSL17-111]|uniref:VOC family protein n=1 Tax=Streptomyces sp. GSL17-111 TaxID=3121596 RepID=UPI0030F389DA
MTSRVHSVTVDSRDPYRLAVFWAEVLGGTLADDDHPGDPEATVRCDGATLLFLTVPEGKTVKNRLHLDIEAAAGSTRDAEITRVLTLGATLADDRRRTDGSGWAVLHDPEGNEFCVVRNTAERTPTHPA